MNPNSIIGNHIFIVEDDAVMQYVLKRIFCQVCTLTLFNNGQECLSALQSGVIPDLMITDLNTPLMNGMKLIRMMKTDSQLCDIPVIVMSADNSPDIIVKCLETGADDFLQKPFQPEVLLNRINRLTEHSREKMCLMLA